MRGGTGDGGRERGWKNKELKKKNSNSGFLIGKRTKNWKEQKGIGVVGG